jgi:phosphopentomutase
MKKFKRVFLVVADSLGAGALPDADKFYNDGKTDEGAHTLASICRTGVQLPFFERSGLFNIDGIGCGSIAASPAAAYGKMAERSAGKDTVTGHWELSGLVSAEPMPTYPQGFPDEILTPFSESCGRGVLCNKPYSGTQVIADYGREHIATGKLIVYTSADSVFQIAAHEDVVPVPELYRCCEIARALLKEKHSVGRVIARPFRGEYPNFERTTARHDYALPPHGVTMNDIISAAGLDVIGVGKISDIFAGVGITESIKTSGNTDGIAKTAEIIDRDFSGLCFVNLVDFDMKYGHRRDSGGYAAAMAELDEALSRMIPRLGEYDALILTADHGCDPDYCGTDHTREYVPVLLWGDGIESCNIGIRASFADLAATVCDMLHLPHSEIAGKSFAEKLMP